ncbi:MAG: DoxX family protein [Pseudomonadota bacterium]
MSMTGNPKPIIPAIAKHYPCAGDWAYLLLRAAAGLMLIPHFWPKLMIGPAAVATNIMARRGIEPALAAAYVTIALEVAGAILITLGLLTRPMAALLVGEFIVIVISHYKTGGWGVSGGGAEFAFLWLIVYVYILARGGGRLSLDAKMGKEF